MTTPTPLQEFAAWFRQNYPGPDTIIARPDWHAPKIFRAATHRLERELAAAKSDFKECYADNQRILEELAAAQEALYTANLDANLAVERAKAAEARAESNAKDAERLQWLMDAPGKWWMEDGGFEAHMTGRLREAIDAAMKEPK